jgi:hypothetical protein
MVSAPSHVRIETIDDARLRTPYRGIATTSAPFSG